MIKDWDEHGAPITEPTVEAIPRWETRKKLNSPGCGCCYRIEYRNWSEPDLRKEDHVNELIVEQVTGRTGDTYTLPSDIIKVRVGYNLKVMFPKIFGSSGMNYLRLEATSRITKEPWLEE